ncbi:hypothetical protein B0H14DRAFT_2644726 [Mycena olivaceomarginata]|nr:hypothetical protein B0H14DRAFT_2644726 [Mycena olivaceomarginata]
MFQVVLPHNTPTAKPTRGRPRPEHGDALAGRAWGRRREEDELLGVLRKDRRVGVVCPQLEGAALKEEDKAPVLGVFLRLRGASIRRVAATGWFKIKPPRCQRGAGLNRMV